MSSKVASFVFENLEKVVCDLGYELCEVEYTKKNSGMNLTLFIAKSDGFISIEDCEKVHRTVDPILDNLNPTEDKPYIFNVSSLGLDRPIKTERDFNRNINKDIVVKLYTPIDKKKEFVGRLSSWTDNSVVLIVGDDVVSIDKKNIALCQPYLEF